MPVNGKFYEKKMKHVLPVTTAGTARGRDTQIKKCFVPHA